MKATKVTHHNEILIRINFPYDAKLLSELRQIPDTRWSKTMCARHIPYTKEAFAQTYTHITTKGFDHIKSPLDKLKIK